ncbi:aberrant root formation protein 4 isoform X2 [Magnolia sinica]|uniref:aberrant root formation protein 4 isoform X2 n=1 Tax=Magnolia sinica TaxID=86752 RepID=UPI00265B00E3|nr:aberrant root formation protein 4 isoform X2 [Magnolia sinica]
MSSSMEESKPNNDLDFNRVQLSDSDSLLSRLQHSLNSCSKSLEAEDFRQSDAAVCDLVDFLDSVSSSALSNPEDEISKRNALEVLTAIRQFVSSPPLDQAIMDALSFELPKVVVKFGGVSDDCREVAESIVDHFVSVCSPRDMLSILCEALDSLPKVLKTPACYVPILSGLSKVFLCIQRRHLEQIKVAVPVILNTVRAVCTEIDDEDKASLRDLLSRAISIASSIQAVCEKLVGKTKEELHGLLGLYILQVMALISSSSLADKVSSCISFVLQLSHFLPFCGLSYLGLITGSDVEAISNMILEVIWGHISDDIAKAAGEDLAAVKSKLQRDQTKRWQAVGMLRYVLSSIDQPWDLQSCAIDFILSIMDGNISREYNGNHSDCSSCMPSLFTALQAVERVIMYASDALLRKKAFTVLKKVLADIPTVQRFDILKALITNNNSPSMIAILIDIVREELLKENHQEVLSRDADMIEVDNKIYPSSPFWSSNVLDLVGFILKPPKGVPPTMPEHSDAVVSALNLYRFLLIKESTGKTNYSGVLSETNLQKAYTEWFLPLRALVSGIEAENEKDCSEFAVDTLCALNPVQLVLYRCIELVEENLKQF